MATKYFNSIVFFDVDNTIVDGYTQKYFIKYLIRKRIISKIYILFSVFWFLGYKLHIIKNTRSAIKFYVKFLKGYDNNDFVSIVEHFFEDEIKNKIFRGAVETIKIHLDKKDKVILISMSLDPIVEKIANYLSADDFIATKLEYSDGRCTGRIAGNVMEGINRVAEFNKYINNIKNKRTFFYTDHHTDINILKMVDEPVVVNPDAILYKEAKKNNWKIIKYK